ncbi:hypothetical protein SCB49_07737 [unidentified eubacterium SCB49]|nr:hypothetical protein SCB49_07737 [unidentified eubacterium SCB49]
MKPLNKNQKDSHQKEGSKREDKKKTNIKFNSAIFFQIGLIVALVVSAWAMNLKIGEHTNEEPYGERFTLDEQTIVDYIIEPEFVPPSKEIAVVTPQPKQPIITDVIKVVEDITPIIETNTVPTPTTPVVIAPPVVTPPVTTTPVKKTGPNTVNSVEFVPIFPGCEGAVTNDARIACMSEKISQFVGKKFNTSVADNSTSGSQNIYVQFKIDKNGDVVDVAARAVDKNLEKEAQRVVSKLPEFTPGKMGDTPVDVLYTLPINFKID